MNRAVERLLALARLDAGVDNMRPERVDVTLLAEQCAALVRPLAEARPEPARQRRRRAQLLADPDKLREVLTNLLHNAIEYNRPQGSIDVSVRARTAICTSPSATPASALPGSAPRTHFRALLPGRPFTRRRGWLHAGLGLAIVKGYVELMGGTIRVGERRGREARFIWSCPFELRNAADARSD